MITADDLTELRGAGKSDDDILKDYREFDPQYNQDIDELLKSGKTARDILDDLVEFNKANPPAQDKMASKGILEKTGGALQYGASQALAGLGATAKHAGWQTGADALAREAKSVAPADYDPAGAKFDFTDPSTYGYAPRAILEGAPGLATDLAAGALGGAAGPAGALAGFTLSNAGRNFGNNVDERLAHQGPDAQAQTSDYLAAGASSVAEAALARVGLNPALSSVTKGAGVKAIAQLPGLIAKATGAEAAAGAAGNLVNQVGRTAGTEDGLSLDLKEIGNNVALSGATAGAIRTARGVGDVTNSVRFAGMDETAAARVVERLDRHGGNTGNAKSAYETVSVARKTLDTEINDANQVLRPLLRSRGNDTDTDNTRVLLKDTITTLKAGAEAPEESLPSLKDRLGGTSEGQLIVSLLEERQALNKLIKSGNFDTREKTFAGGMADSSIGRNILDPRAIYRNKILGGGTAAGVAGLSAAGQAAALAPVAGKVLAGQVVAYTTARLLDKATGLRNPAGEFMDRFRGQGEQPTAEAPSYRQMAQDAQAQAVASREAQRLAKGEAKEAAQAEAKRTKETEAAYAQRTKQDKQEQGIRDAKEADYGKAEAQRRAKTPEQVKAEQEDALWRSQEAPASQDWSEDDALAAIRGEIASRQKASDALTKLSAKAAETKKKAETKEAEKTAKAQAKAIATAAKAAETKKKAETKEAEKTAKAQAKAIATAAKAAETKKKAETKEAEKTAKAQPQQQPQAEPLQIKVKPTSTESDPETIRITHGDQVVERPVEGIRNVNAYTAKTKSRMETRQNFSDAVLKRVGERQKPYVDAMLGKLNNSAKSFEDAYYIIEEAINDLPAKAQGELWDIWNKHEGKLKATYDR